MKYGLDERGSEKRIPRKILVALGGNALIKRGQEGTAAQQVSNAREAAKVIITLLEVKNRLLITHGNGPQVGDILLKNELAKSNAPPMPLDVCGAESQGMLGYILQQALDNEARRRRLKVSIVSIVSQTIVNLRDPAFKNPSKPVGPFYAKEEALQLEKERSWKMTLQDDRGYRRLVPSPKPIASVEEPMIRTLFNEGFVVIQSGGGGVPVIKKPGGGLVGVEAVIDKDLTAAVIASDLKMDLLLMLTDVEKVALNFGKPDQVNLDRLNVRDCMKYVRQGQFANGSMGPKIKAAVNFLESGGTEAIITSLDTAVEALQGKTGTKIIP